MVAGLLICDHVDEEYQEHFGDYGDMFRSLFSEFEWKEYDVTIGEYPKNVNVCDVYFSTGSRHSVYDKVEWIRQLEDFTRTLYEANKYFIGVCFGHQIIGKALGGHVAKSTKGWCVGVHQFKIQKEMNWMVPKSDKIQLLMMCQDQVLELPNNSVVLGSNDMCPNAMIMVGDTFLGVQAHPEYSREYNKYLMTSRVNRIGVTSVEDGIASLDLTIDKSMFKDWILKFLEQKGYDS